jgi:hypothetical protein
MPRTLQLLLLSAVFTLSACVGGRGLAEPARLSTRLPRERALLVRYDGPTSEPSCGGTALSVYLRGGQVRRLDWTIETSTRLIRRQYSFAGPSPHLAIETISARLDANAEPLAQPRLLSTKPYHLDAARPTPKQSEFLDHAKFLITDFNEHRKEFSRVWRSFPCKVPRL